MRVAEPHDEPNDDPTSDPTKQFTVEKSCVYLVATPIGTLADLSQRAKLVLSTVDVILCEDTRKTKQLLNFLDIKASGQLRSFHSYSEHQKAESIIQEMLEGLSAALVSDAGTPCISDPGYFLVQKCHESKIKILSLPGPSSLTSAMAASGFSAPHWIFSGFLPRGDNEIRQKAKEWETLAPCVAVFYESPNRILDTLRTLAAMKKSEETNEPLVCVSREISKRFEEHVRGSFAEAITALSDRTHSLGECVVSIFFPKPIQKSTAINLQVSMEELGLLARFRSQKSAQKLRVICKQLAAEVETPAGDIYAAAAGKENPDD